MKAFLHILSHDNTLTNKSVEINQVPAIGCTISFSVNGALFKVINVHFNFFDCEYPIEIVVTEAKSII